MHLPSYDQLMLPLLVWLDHQTQAVTISDATNAISDQLKLSEIEREALLPSGKQKVIVNRLGWAKFFLLKAGLVNSSQRGFFQISEIGRKLVANPPAHIDKAFLMKYEGFSNFIKKESDSLPEVKTKQNKSIDSVAETLTPVELIDQQFDVLNRRLRDELLAQLKSVSPSFFERLVIDLLVAMGYGGSYQDAAQAIGRSGDGGIDGIISEDRLGLDQIYIQAKRWEGTVGRPEIQKFKGAMSDQLATKGVFITTSSYTKEAVESARKSRLILMDGERVARLMIEYGVGVNISQTYNVHNLDLDYFAEE
jgi:restriction system protein